MKREDEANSTGAIEVTPAMIEAGCDVIRSRWCEMMGNPSDALYREVSVEVYLAMMEENLRERS